MSTTNFVLAMLIVFSAAAGAGTAEPAAANPSPQTFSYSRMLVDENFQALADVTPVKGFQAYGGSWQIKEGLLWAAGENGPKLILDEPPFATGEVGVEILLPDARGGNAGLIVKVSQPGVGADHFHGLTLARDDQLFAVAGRELVVARMRDGLMGAGVRAFGS